MQSENINELACALSKAQGEMKNASKDGLNPHLKSKYATLGSIWEACREPLSRHGLSASQLLNQEGENVLLTTILMHSSGQWIKSTVSVIAGKPTPQALGSSITYMRRYSLASIIGITAGDDDDAEESEKHHVTHSPEEKISKEQASQISQLVGEDIDLYNKILNGYRVSALTDIPSKHFQIIIRNIKSKKGIE